MPIKIDKGTVLKIVRKKLLTKFNKYTIMLFIKIKKGRKKI